jgi:hypothetical protein
MLEEQNSFMALRTKISNCREIELMFNQFVIVRSSRTIQKNSESIIHTLDPLVKPGNDKDSNVREVCAIHH